MKLVRALLCCALVAAAPAFAQKRCSTSDAAAADKAIDRASSWQALYKAYKDYHHCDAGKVSDTFTDTLLRLMVDWKNVDALASSVAADPEYKSWIEARLKSPAAQDDLPTVYSRARTMCPASQAAFCTELADMTRPAKAAGAPATAPPEILDFTPMKPIKTP